MFKQFLMIGVVVFAACGFASARNVDLSTVPKRDTVSLTIYNSEDLTLVRETRTVTFKKGVNPLQFSWANTQIDPTSVELKFVTNGEKLDVLDTTFPHDKPQMLYWNVQSDFDGEATIAITYFTSGITWSADYLAIANEKETSANLEGFVRVSNNSGEEYENASVRLIVGKINIVQKIAELAHIALEDVNGLDQSRKDELQQKARREVLRSAAGKADLVATASPMNAPKEIIKEGLSEYFVFTIEGTETIQNGWSKRLRSIEPATVPVKMQYRYRPAEYGEQLVRMYLMTNDKDSKLGTTPLPDGVVRVFRDNGRGEGHDGLSYVTQQAIKYIPIGDKIELNLGADPKVVFELIKQKAWRDDIWARVNGADVYKRADEPGVTIDVNSEIAGWAQHEQLVQRIRNYTGSPIDVEIRRAFPGHVLFRSALKPTLYDYQTVQIVATAKPGRNDLAFEVVHEQGHNAKQSNVKLEGKD